MSNDPPRKQPLGPISNARKAAFGLIAAGIFFVLIELAAYMGLALLGPGQVPLTVGWEGDAENADRLIDAIYVPDDRLFFKLRPNLDVPVTPNPRIFDLQTNALGLRGKPVVLPKPDDLFRILCLGDSCTFGSGAAANQTIPAQLEQELTDRRPDLRIEVINAGVPGYTTYQARQFFESDGIALQPDCVVLTLGYNDALPTGPAVKRRFRADLQLSDREYADARKSVGFLAITRLAQRLTGAARSPSDSTVQNSVTKRRVSLDDYRDNLNAILDLCSQRGAQAIIVAWPVEPQSRPDVPMDLGNQIFILYQAAARTVAAQRSSPLVDLVPILAGRSDLYIDHVHVNPTGYGIAARAIADAVAPLLPVPTPKK